MITKENFTRVNNDVNGNPRFVTHFYNLLSVAEQKYIDGEMSWDRINRLYSFAVEKAKKIGGKKYRGKDFGGGVVFQSYNLNFEIDAINNMNR